MGFRRSNRDGSSFPPSPNSVNTSPKSSNVLMPRTTIRKRIVDPFDEPELDPQSVYEMKRKDQTVNYSGTNIKPSLDRAKTYPGDADRPDLDSSLSYVYHSVIDRCCGDTNESFTAIRLE